MSIPHRPLPDATSDSNDQGPQAVLQRTRLRDAAQSSQSPQSPVVRGRANSAEGSGSLSQQRRSSRAPGSCSNASSLKLSRESSRAQTPERISDARFQKWLEDSHASALNFRASAPTLQVTSVAEAPVRRTSSTGGPPQAALNRKVSLADLKRFPPLAPLSAPPPPSSSSKPRLQELSPLPAQIPSKRGARMDTKPVDTGLASQPPSPLPSNAHNSNGDANLLSMARTEEDLAMNPDMKPEPSVNSAKNPGVQPSESTSLESIDKAIAALDKYGALDSHRHPLPAVGEHTSSHRTSVKFDRADSVSSKQSKHSSAPSKSTTSTARMRRKKKKDKHVSAEPEEWPDPRKYNPRSLYLFSLDNGTLGGSGSRDKDGLLPSKKHTICVP